MFVKIKFHGMLGKILPEIYRVEAETAAEAIRAVTMQFRKQLVRKDGMMFSAICKEFHTRFELFSHIPDGLPEEPEINIYPAFAPAGGGGGNTALIVGGIVLLAGVAILTGGFGLAAAPAIAAGGWSATAALTGWGLVAIGGGMMLLGLSQMMVPKTDTSSSDSTESSRVFGANTNTTKIGTRIAVGYGKYRVYGQYLSVNTQAVDRSL